MRIIQFLHTMETWKKVKLKYKCRTKYFVSDLGRCKSKQPDGFERLVNGRRLRKSYVKTVDYTIPATNGKRHFFCIPLEVARNFIPKPSKPNMVICLKNPKAKPPFAANNLIYRTTAQRAKAVGIKYKQLSRFKLSDNDIAKIRSTYKKGNTSYVKLAEKFNVTPYHIYRILKKHAR